MPERELQSRGQQRHAVLTTELPQSGDPLKHGRRGERVARRHAVRRVRQYAALENPGRDDRDTELLAERKQLCGAGLVEEGVAPGEQDAVRPRQTRVAEEAG